MKGITPVIAIILLLLITISMVGFAFVWFSKMQTNIQDTVTNNMNNQTTAMAKTVKIDSAVTGHVEVRNSGSVSIAGTEYKVYVNGVPLACVNNITLAPGAVADCAVACATGATVRVTSPGNLDETTCE